MVGKDVVLFLWSHRLAFAQRNRSTKLNKNIGSCRRFTICLVDLRAANVARIIYISVYVTMHTLLILVQFA